MRNKSGRILSLVLLMVLLVSTFSAGSAKPALQDSSGLQPEVRYAIRFDSFGPLRIISPIEPRWKGLIEVEDEEGLPNRPGAPVAPSIDPVLQQGTLPAPNAAIGSNFEGVNNVDGVLPPDTNGDIGPNHYVQIVNLSFAIYNRSGTKLYGPAHINTLWSGFGGYCQTSNDGDPIVLYDHLAGRWLISQFALPRYPFGPFYQCIAISQTGDPTGSWYRYAFLYSKNKMNDYPHFGVWPDGYYMSANQFSSGLGSWAGAGAVVFERNKMLQGQAARMVYFDLFGVDSNLGGMLPSHLNGPVPPAGEPNHYMEMDDDSYGYSPDQVQMWDFHVDWTTTANSTFRKAGAWQTAAFDSNMCGGARNCISQPGGTRVDAISDRLMYRLQYRNFGSYRTLVVNHTVDVDGTDHAGIRWYELRNNGSGWSIYQQGTFAPDASHRWMGSVAMNGKGEIGLGYSVSSTSVYPSIRFTGRLTGDPLGQMTQGESTIINGSGWQDHSAGRWGDYSSLSVDPADDCTFWYTQEYFTSQVAGNASWQTRVGSFRLSDCGTPVDNPPSVGITSPANGATVAGNVTITANASDDHGVTQVQFFVDGSSLGTDTNGADGWSMLWNTTTIADGSHNLTAVATDTASQTSTSSPVAVTVNNHPITQTMHVGDLDGSTTSSGLNRWNAFVTITVHDANHNPLAGVTVGGAWSNGASGTSTCTTDSTGKCQVSKSNLNKRTTPSVTFSINSLTLTGYTYDATANHDPESDSNGTTITVKP